MARQVWALSDIPIPQDGINENSYYSNFHYLLSLEKNKHIPQNIKRCFPWVILYLWKNRNEFLFEGKRQLPTELVAKIKEEVEFWFLAQEKDKEVENNLRSSTQRGGVSWILQDDYGKVLIHSRRAFFLVSSLYELKSIALKWSVECMIDHRKNKVIFALEDAELIGMVLRPKAWPSLKFQSTELMRTLSKMDWWRLEKKKKINNRGAFLIAQSVTRFDLVQSYVATGSPDWLKQFFADEEGLPSV
ncbi:hypothetical protein N665_0806s0005 [Sinapis alba]|nr:hypothetical protein N665_0806s0005 [Sinapis alba]